MTEAYYQGKELFKGTAWYYARYRPAYPPQLFDLLVEKFRLNGSGSLLDLGCGPGDLAIPLASYFEKVIALDADAEMLTEGRRKAVQAGIANIEWVHGRAEQMPPDWGPFKLIVIGQFFHWMAQQKVLDSVVTKLQPGGGLTIIGVQGRLWSGRAAWHEVVLSVIKKYLGEKRRAGSGTAKFSGIGWENLLDSRFPKTEYDLSTHQTDRWSAATLTGYLYSTSYCSRALLGDRVESFERDLEKALLIFNPQNEFTEVVTSDVLMGWK